MTTEHFKGRILHSIDIGVAAGNTYIVDKNAELYPQLGYALAEAAGAGANTYIIKGELYGHLETFGIGTTIRVTESGEIHGSGGASAIIARGNAVSIVNDGDITGNGSWAVSLEEYNSDATNNGTITGYMGIRAWEAAEITNSKTGEIYAQGGGIVQMADPGDDTITRNFGKIVGHGASIFTADGDDRVINRGTLKGDVELGIGKDVFDNRGGSLKGDISGGNDDDTFILDSVRNNVIETDTGGMDRVKATVSYILPDFVEKLVLLTAKNLEGAGNGMANELIGNRADNILSGLGSDDILRGGKGADVLIGGEGGDVFHFATGYGKDRIADFASGEDKIDLSAWSKIESFDDLTAHHLRQDGKDLVIRAGHDVLVLEKTTAADIAQSDFDF